MNQNIEAEREFWSAEAMKHLNPDPELMGVIACGWCTEANEGKEMDSDLAYDIARHVTAWLASRNMLSPLGAGVAAPVVPVSEQNARYAIETAIGWGREGSHKPPAEDHWLMPYWKIGQHLGPIPYGAECVLAIAPTLPEAAAQEGDSADVSLMVKRLRNMGLAPCNEAAAMLESLAAKQAQPVPDLSKLTRYELTQPGHGESDLHEDTRGRVVLWEDVQAALATHPQPAFAKAPSVSNGSSNESSKAAPSEGAQAEKKQSGLVGWQNAIEELSDTPTAAADGAEPMTYDEFFAEAERLGCKLAPEDCENLLASYKDRAAAPLASSADGGEPDSIDTLAFQRLLNRLSHDTGVAYAETKQALIAHIHIWADTRIAEARQQGYEEGIEVGAKEAEHWQKISKPDHQCGSYIAGAIRAVGKSGATPAAASPLVVELPPLADLVEWSYSTDEERYHGQEASREAIIAHALSEVGDDASQFWIGKNKRFTGRGDATGVIEALQEQAYEECGEFAETYLDDVTKDEEQELADFITAWASRVDRSNFWTVYDVERIEVEDARAAVALAVKGE